jgi:hypothetical protein
MVDSAPEAGSMTPNADLWTVMVRLLDRRGIGPNPTDAQLVEAAGWMHDVMDSMADCGYRLEAERAT